MNNPHIGSDVMSFLDKLISEREAQELEANMNIPEPDPAWDYYQL